MAASDQTLAARFNAKWNLDRSAGCWLWTAALNSNGYGLLQTGTHDQPLSSLAHRISWELHRGAVPAGLKVLHRCDVPRCVRPEHLFLGTQADNMADMSRKRRSGSTRHPDRRPRGTDHALSKLDESRVLSIRASLEGGESIRALARRHAVDRRTITSIRDGLTWRHV